ncbi:MAG TPA: calcium-binding protein [Allosphingosinicella sp.]|nr:calcium-binding protein [Allosphingosinicella sp.]
MAVINGTSEGEALFGTRFEDEINGLGGNDVLRGRGGGDRLDGGAGADRMLGRSGNDIYLIDHAGDRAGERFDEGIDTVIATLAYRLQRNIEHLELRGTAKFGTGNDLDNRIDATGQTGGRAIANVLDGGSGADVMAGGRGRDIYYVDNIGDTFEEVGRLEFDPDADEDISGDPNLDRVIASISFTLPGDIDATAGVAHVEDLTLTGTADLDGTGNGVQNSLTGNSGNNLLRGLGGTDRLSGGAGNDELRGGDGNDILNGGAGNDVLIGGEGGNVFRFDSFDADSTDFRQGNGFQLDVRVFTALADVDDNEGRIIDEEAFAEAGEESESDDRIIYNATTGELFYDSDGSGPAAQLLFATVEPGTEVNFFNFATYG